MRQLLYLFIFVCTSLLAKEPNIYLVTYPRSATNWMMYCMTTLTDRGWSLNSGTPYRPAGVQRDPTLQPFRHTHNFQGLQRQASPNKDLLILLLRNYKECMIRQCGSIDAVLKTLPKESVYFKNLQLFDEWAPERRLLVYYEDFMRYPEETLARAMEFVASPNKNRLKMFIKELPQHREKVFQYYRSKRRGGTNSQGKDLLYHSKNVDKEKLVYLDEYAQKMYPNLFDKYLWMYAE